MVYMSNLSFNATEQDLMEFFKQHKFEAIRARLLYDNEGNSKGFGFVELSSEDEASQAIKNLSGESILGRKVQISLKK